MKTVWTSYNGTKRSFDAMDNEHLANVIKHMEYYAHQYPLAKYLEAMKVVTERGLTSEFLAKAPYPFKDLKTGNWYIWSFEVNYVVPFVLFGSKWEDRSKEEVKPITDSYNKVSPLKPLNTTKIKTDSYKFTMDKRSKEEIDINDLPDIAWWFRMGR
jgi:hypothetical protein